MAAEWFLPDVSLIKSTGPDWFIQYICEVDESTRVRLVMLFWRIWYVRNELVHFKPAPPLDVSVRFLSSYLSSLQSIATRSGDVHVKGKAPLQYRFPLTAHACNNASTNLVSWIPPATGHVKLNTDGSVLNGVGGTGMLLRDHTGAIIFSSCRHLFSCDDILEAEILAIREGLMLALQWSSLPIYIESDSLEAVNMVKSGDTNRSKYAFLIREIKDSMSERSSCITHIHRSCNNSSHVLANYGRTQGRIAVWLGSGPDAVLDAVKRDCNRVLIE